MNKINFLVLNFLLLFSIALNAKQVKNLDNIIFSFKGIELGMTVEELKKVNSPTMSPASLVCIATSEDPSKGFYGLLSQETSKTLKELGGDSCVYTDSMLFFQQLSLMYGLYFIKMPKDSEPKLFNMWMDIGITDYNELLHELTKKYGTPKTVTQLVSNKMNAKFKNIHSTWENKSGKIILSKYSNSLDTSSLTFVLKDYQKHFFKLQKNYEQNKPSKI